MCNNHKGVEAVRKLPALVKRLHALVEELTRKANMEKRLAFFPPFSRLNLFECLLYYPELKTIYTNFRLDPYKKV